MIAKELSIADCRKRKRAEKNQMGGKKKILKPVLGFHLCGMPVTKKLAPLPIAKTLGKGAYSIWVMGEKEQVADLTNPPNMVFLTSVSPINECHLGL